MKKIIIYFVYFGIIPFVHANNISIGDITVTDQDVSAGANNVANYTFVKFNLSWENSWRTSTPPSNWDAAWVFVKYRIAGGNWQHANLNDLGHVVPSTATYYAGLLHPDSSFNMATNPCLGVFIYRANDGSGTFALNDVKLRWNYGAAGVGDNDLLEVQVFAIEMVYVPQGAFYVGSGGNETGALSMHPSTTTPYLIGSEDSINVGTTNGYLRYQAGPNSGDALGPIPAKFPKGYNAFYSMKYELSQYQYVDFLNTLNYHQQTSRASFDGTAIVGMSVLYTAASYRNSIVLKTIGYADSIPCTFACDFNHNLIFDEPNDGQWIACNYLSWEDIASYFDWSGLRPMTELEYEKLARGTASPIANEYAWGTTSITAGANFINPATDLESFSDVGANAVFNAGNTQGPARVGAFASATSTRAESGAGYYGAMELSGNLNERVITIGNANGRSYKGIHGDGTVNFDGDYDVSSWPPNDSNGAGYRGGNWSNGSASLRLSARNIAAQVSAGRGQNETGRGVRTAP
ncbi:MAG TPA: hypothetical protein PK323_13890 [Bacteroidia bacterium]|nr:hypothetical protein [Bacteroidia bacterium]